MKKINLKKHYKKILILVFVLILILGIIVFVLFQNHLFNEAKKQTILESGETYKTDTQASWILETKKANNDYISSTSFIAYAGPSQIYFYPNAFSEKVFIGEGYGATFSPDKKYVYFVNEGESRRRFSIFDTSKLEVQNIEDGFSDADSTYTETQTVEDSNYKYAKILANVKNDDNSLKIFNKFFDIQTKEEIFSAESSGAEYLPNSNKILYVSKGIVYIYDIDSKESKKILEGDFNMDFSVNNSAVRYEIASVDENKFYIHKTTMYSHKFSAYRFGWLYTLETFSFNHDGSGQTTVFSNLNKLVKIQEEKKKSEALLKKPSSSNREELKKYYEENYKSLISESLGDYEHGFTFNENSNRNENLDVIILFKGNSQEYTTNKAERYEGVATCIFNKQNPSFGNVCLKGVSAIEF